MVDRGAAHRSKYYTHLHTGRQSAIIHAEQFRCQRQKLHIIYYFLFLIYYLFSRGVTLQMLLKNKTVVLGITGGIAAYKMPNVAHALVKLGADVHVLMTKNATEFISPLVFETLTRRRCQVDTFDRNFQYDVAHISLANAADLMLIAPATANVIAKLAHGQADDMLTTVTLAATCPKLVAPAMNTHMLENPITQDNLKTLEHYGFTVIPSGSGMLACGDVGSGRLPDEGVLVDYVLRELACAKDLKGKKVVVSAGATQEPMDPCAT